MTHLLRCSFAVVLAACGTDEPSSTDTGSDPSGTTDTESTSSQTETSGTETGSTETTETSETSETSETQTTETAPTGARVCSDPTYYSYTITYAYWRDAGASDNGVRYVVDPPAMCYDIDLPPGDYEFRVEAPYCGAGWTPATVVDGERVEVLVELLCYG